MSGESTVHLVSLDAACHFWALDGIDWDAQAQPSNAHRSARVDEAGARSSYMLRPSCVFFFLSSVRPLIHGVRCSVTTHLGCIGGLAPCDRRGGRAGEIFFDTVRRAGIVGVCGEQIPQCFENRRWRWAFKEPCGCVDGFVVLANRMKSLLIKAWLLERFRLNTSDKQDAADQCFGWEGSIPSAHVWHFADEEPADQDWPKEGSQTCCATTVENVSPLSAR